MVLRASAIEAAIGANRGIESAWRRPIGRSFAIPSSPRGCFADLFLSAVGGESMARPKGSKWHGPLGQSLVLDAKVAKEGGLSSDDDAIRTIRSRPPWNKWDQETLLRLYRKARRFHGDTPPPIAAEQPTDASIIDAPNRDRWMSSLCDWANEAKRRPPCRSREQLCELINRLNAIPAPWSAHVDQLFTHMECRRHSWRGRQKIEWLEAVPGRLARNPLDWPIPATRRGRPDKQARLVLTAVRKGKETKDDIADDTGINPDSLQTLLNRMVESKELGRTERGRYVEWTEGLVSYERPDVDKEILNVLADGPATPPEMSDRTGIGQGSINKGVRRLRKAGKIDLIERARSAERGSAALYAIAGTAAPYVFVEDAIVRVLQSGGNTDPELEAATGRKLSAIKAARGRLEAKGDVKRDGVRGGFAVWTLSRQRRRRARRPAPDSGRIDARA
jgi:hypothetical protein